MEIDGAAGGPCGQLPLHRLGRSSSIAPPASRARARDHSE
jgi:hypothetical protein